VFPGFEDVFRLEGRNGAALRVREARREQRPEGLEEEVFREVPVDAHQPLAGVDIDGGGREQFVQRGERAARELRVAEGFAHGPVQGVGAEVVGRFAVGAASIRASTSGTLPAVAAAISGVWFIGRRWSTPCWSHWRRMSLKLRAK
jgi:hypothetical protein